MKRQSTWVVDARLCWVILCVFTLFSITVPTSGRAALIESRTADGIVASDRGEQIESIRQALEKEIVVQRLADYGMSPAEVSAKLPAMSDAQLHQLASLSDGVGAGGVHGAVIAVLLIIILVWFILEIADDDDHIHIG